MGKTRISKKTEGKVIFFAQSAIFVKIKRCKLKILILKRMTMNYTFETKTFPTMHVAYCRHYGAYDQIGEAFKRLEKWAHPKGLLKNPKTLIIAVYHDDPMVTKTNQLKSDACISIDKTIATKGDVETCDLPGGLFAVGSFKLKMGEFPKAWKTLLQRLEHEGYTCANQSPFEIYHNNAMEHPEQIWIIDICISVEKKHV